MPLCRRTPNYKKTYTLSTTKKIHEQIQKLAKDSGTSNQEITSILLTTALASLNGNLKQEIVERRINEAQSRLLWLNGIKSLAESGFDPPIIPVNLKGM